MDSKTKKTLNSPIKIKVPEGNLPKNPLLQGKNLSPSKKDGGKNIYSFPKESESLRLHDSESIMLDSKHFDSINPLSQNFNADFTFPLANHSIITKRTENELKEYFQTRKEDRLEARFKQRQLFVEEMRLRKELQASLLIEDPEGYIRKIICLPEFDELTFTSRRKKTYTSPPLLSVKHISMTKFVFGTKGNNTCVYKVFSPDEKWSFCIPEEKLNTRYLKKKLLENKVKICLGHNSRTEFLDLLLDYLLNKATEEIRYPRWGWNQKDDGSWIFVSEESLILCI